MLPGQHVILTPASPVIPTLTSQLWLRGMHLARRLSIRQLLTAAAAGRDLGVREPAVTAGSYALF
jgi:hypothetical protein